MMKIVFTSWLDTKYFTFLPQQEVHSNNLNFTTLNHKIYGNFKIWVERDNVWSNRKSTVVYNTVKNVKYSLYTSFNRRTNKYKINKINAQYVLKNDYNELLTEINKIKNNLKKEYTKQKAKEYQEKVKLICKTKGITKEEYVKQNKNKIQEKKKREIQKKNVEFTNQVIKLAPLIKDIKEQTETILNKFVNESNCNTLPRIERRLYELKNVVALLKRINYNLNKRKKIV